MRRALLVLAVGVVLVTGGWVAGRLTRPASPLPAKGTPEAGYAQYMAALKAAPTTSSVPAVLPD